MKSWKQVSVKFTAHSLTCTLNIIDTDHKLDGSVCFIVQYCPVLPLKSRAPWEPQFVLKRNLENIKGNKANKIWPKQKKIILLSSEKCKAKSHENRFRNRSNLLLTNSKLWISTGSNGIKYCICEMWEAIFHLDIRKTYFFNQSIADMLRIIESSRLERTSKTSKISERCFQYICLRAHKHLRSSLEDYSSSRTFQSALIIERKVIPNKQQHLNAGKLGSIATQEILFSFIVHILSEIIFVCL